MGGDLRVSCDRLPETFAQNLIKMVEGAMTDQVRKAWNKSVQILVVSAYYRPAYVYGGPVESIHKRTLAISGPNLEVRTYTTDANGTEDLNEPLEQPVLVDGIPVTYFPRWWFGRAQKPRNLFFSPAMGRQLRRLHPGDFDLILIHATFCDPGRMAAAAAKRTGTPYICYTHGTFEPWKLGYKKYKKKIYMALIEGKLLQNAAGIVVCNEAEKEFLREYGINAPIKRIPWGGKLINPDEMPQRHILDELFPELKGKRFLLFLSRLHLIKGLDLLIASFGDLAQIFTDWQLVIAGPDEGDYKSNLLELVKNYGISHRVIFTGMVTGLKKTALLSHADVYTLPSYSEGFSISVVEALSYGRPVVISNTCYVPEVSTGGAGLEVPPEKQSLTEALRVMMREDSLRQKCSQNAYELSRKYFTWDSVAHETLTFFHECLNRRV